MTAQFVCQKCGAAFSNQQALMEHNQKAHPMGAQQAQVGQEHFKCTTCGAEFHSQAELMQHTKTAHAM
jgi:uncharacterized C2H2 Zn-finger protein